MIKQDNLLTWPPIYGILEASKGGHKMLGKQKTQSDFFDDYVYKKLLPHKHILLDILEHVDFSFVEEELHDLYNSTIGRSSYPPEILFKVLFLEFYYKLSDVEVVKQCQVNLLYRYFVGLAVDDKTPDDTTLVIFRRRCGQERFERLFDRLVEQCRQKGLLKERLKIVDATAIEADVAIPNTVNLLRQGRRVIAKKINKDFPQQKDKLSAYVTKERLHQKPKPEELQAEVAKTQEFIEQTRGTFGADVDELLSWLEEIYSPERTRAKAVSFVDSDARHGVKSPRRMFSGYKAHVICDESGLATSIDIFSGNKNEGNHLAELLDKDESKAILGEAVVADALYDSGANRQDICNRGMKAYIPNRRNRRYADAFTYNAATDQFVCPQGGISRLPKNRQAEGYFHNFSTTKCRTCPTKCGAFKGKRTRLYISDSYQRKLKDDDDFYAEALNRRKMIERKFGEVKKWHGLSRARYRGKWRVSIQVLMTFLVVNAKKMANLLKQKSDLSLQVGKLAVEIG